MQRVHWLRRSRDLPNDEAGSGLINLSLRFHRAESGNPFLPAQDEPALPVRVLRRARRAARTVDLGGPYLGRRSGRPSTSTVAPALMAIPPKFDLFLPPGRNAFPPTETRIAPASRSSSWGVFGSLGLRPIER